MRILDINVNEQGKALYRNEGGGNLWRELGEKGKEQVLTEAQILELSELIVKIENHYGFPCDIEWAMENGKLYIVQSRPITTLRVGAASSPKAFVKFSTRDFCMIALEVVAMTKRPWLGQEPEYKPFILIGRTDGTNSMWYNKKGIFRTCDVLVANARGDSYFLVEIEERIRAFLAHLKPVYTEQKVLNRQDLIHFINEFLSAYSRVEAMWNMHGMKIPEVIDSRIGSLRAETETLSVGTDMVIRKSLEKIYPRLGIFSSMIRFDELRNDAIPQADILHARFMGFTLVDDELSIEPLFDVARENNFILEQTVADLDAKGISGEVAHKGVVRGKVCRIMGHGDFGKIQEGQILVSPMTMADFLPEMKKAGAIVTDEGGVTCHAAIIARELKIPCVIGTKIATQVLHDGDFVEVDADNGVVRIIERAGISS